MNNLWEKYAKVLVEYSVDVQPGDLTVIRTDSYLSQPLIKEIYKQVLLRGAHPVVRMGTEGLNEIFIKYADDAQLEYIDPMLEAEYKLSKKMISIGAPLNVRNMARSDAKKMAKRSSVMKDLSAALMQRVADGDFKWVIADFPTQALAQEAKMSLDEYTDFLVKACYLHFDNPVAKWKEIAAAQKRIENYLNGKSQIRITGEKTDITFNVSGRIWKNCAGEFNFPDGEVYTSPVEDGINGQIYFDFPQIYRGNEAQKVLLTLKDGKVIDAKAEKGEEFLNNMLDMDEGARFVGEIAIGTNDMIQDITGNILFDEKIGGSIHMAVGASYPETGGKNVSGLHWDLIKNMKNGGKIYADGELFYENGKFII